MKQIKDKMRTIIVTNNHLYANMILKSFLAEYHDDVVGIIIPDFILPKKNFFQVIKYFLSKSIHFSTYKFIEKVIYEFKVRLGLGDMKSFETYLFLYGMKTEVFKTKDINDVTTIKYIRSLRPDIIYVVSFPQKIRPEVFTIPEYCINFHDSLLPDYKGMCPYFWTLMNNEEFTGATAHFIEKEFDTGKMLSQREFKIEKDDTAQNVYYKSNLLIRDMIKMVHKYIKSNNVESYEQEKGGRYYSFPDKEGYKQFKKNKKKLFKFSEVWNSV